jgi:hypothetical protein
MNHDQKQLANGESYRSHWSNPFVLLYIAQVQAVQQYGPNKEDAVEAFVSISSLVFQCATTLINSFYSVAKESIVYQTGIFSLLPFCIGGITSSDINHVSPLTLQSVLLSLNNLLSVTGQHTNPDSVRQKLARVRASGVLLKPLWKSVSDTKKSDSAPATKRKLLSSVESVFTDIFNEFAEFEVPNSSSHGGRPLKLMSGPDFIRFQRSLSEATLKDPFKRGLRTTRETRFMNQQFLHYGMFLPSSADAISELLEASAPKSDRKSPVKDEKKSAAPATGTATATALTKVKKRNKNGESLVLESLFLDVRSFIRMMRDQCVVCLARSALFSYFASYYVRYLFVCVGRIHRKKYWMNWHF